MTEGVQALLLRGEELAKGWLLALVEDAPLESAAAIMAGDVARDGPRICDAVVRAIYDEADLRRIEPGGVLEPLMSRAGEPAGVRSAETAARAVEALRSVIWSALRIELARTDPDMLADAGERLSLVADFVRAAVLRRRADGEPRPSVPPLRVARTDLPVAPREGRVGVGRPERRGEESATPGLAGTGGPVEAGGGAGGGFENGGVTERTDGAAAQALGSRIVMAVPMEEPWRGAPLTVSVGLAVLGEDGHNAAALIDAAEQGRFAAEASGIGILTGQPENGDSDPPPGPSLVS